MICFSLRRRRFWYGGWCLCAWLLGAEISGRRIDGILIAVIEDMEILDTVAKSVCCYRIRLPLL